MILKKKRSKRNDELTFYDSHYIHKQKLSIIWRQITQS